MFTTIFGKKIYYEMYGAEHGNTLLYLHGGPGASCLDFAGQASKGHTIGSVGRSSFGCHC